MALLLCTQLPAQGGGQPPNEVLRLDTGFVSAPMGDLDGDGVDEIIIGDMHYEQPNGSLVNNGIARVHSGATGAVIYTKEGANSWDNFGSAVSSAGDTNRDGIPDFIIGATGASPNGLAGAGAAYLYSGADGALIRMFPGATAGGEFGWSVAGAGDVDKDNHDDVIIGDPYDLHFGGAVGSGVAEVYSGLDGTLMWQKIGAGDELVGYVVAAAGDVNNDGFADVIISSPGWDNGANANQGKVQIYSGKDWAVFMDLQGSADSYFGQAVATGGDVNGDTADDLIIGEPLATPASMGFVQTGAAYAYNLNGILLHTWTGENAGDQFGSSVALIADLNGDFSDECLVGSPLSDPNSLWDAGSAFLYSGIDGAQMHRWDGADFFINLGSQVQSCSDLSGDGLEEFLISTEKDYSTSLSGSTSAWSWEPDPYLTASATNLSSARPAGLARPPSTV